MSNLIDRQAAIEAVQNRHMMLSKEKVLLINDLEKLPSAEPEQRTGKWIDVNVMGMPAQACDQCNTFYPLAYTGGGHHYCPNCGAKMEVTT